MKFSEMKIGDRVYLKSDILSEIADIKHCFTTRLGGVSHGNIKGFNFGFRVNDDYNSVMQNYKIMSDDLGFEFKNTVLAKQTHTDNIRIVKECDKGKGLTAESDIEDTDGLVTDLKNVPLVVFSADCTPILLYDDKKKVAAAVHSGWRGTVKQIGKKAVEIMKREFGCNPDNIVAAIGSHIRQCCFEVDFETASNFDDKYIIFDEKIGKPRVDLLGVNIEMLKDSGISDKNISYSDECTKCGCDKFYSYRADKERTGRMCAVIEITG